MTTAASSSAASETRYTTHTRRPLRAGAGRSWKNATSSADDSPTSSQPANSVSIVPASDATHHARGRRARTGRRTGCNPRSRCMYRLANAPIVPHSTNDRIANGTDSRSNTNLTEKW